MNKILDYDRTKEVTPRAILNKEDSHGKTSFRCVCTQAMGRGSK